MRRSGGISRISHLSGDRRRCKDMSDNWCSSKEQLGVKVLAAGSGVDDEGTLRSSKWYYGLVITWRGFCSFVVPPTLTAPFLFLHAPLFQANDTLPFYPSFPLFKTALNLPEKISLIPRVEIMTIHSIYFTSFVIVFRYSLLFMNRDTSKSSFFHHY